MVKVIPLRSEIMVKSRSRRLKEALNRSLELIGDDSLVMEQSEDSKRKNRISLLKRSSTVRRPTYQRIAERNLGPKSSQSATTIQLVPETLAAEGGLADIVSGRLNELRKQTDWVNESSTDSKHIQDSEWLGFDLDGMPIWQSVMEQQHSRLGATSVAATVEADNLNLNIEFNPPIHSPNEKWALEFQDNLDLSFKTFHVCQENGVASKAANEILERPARRINPLIVFGPSGTGKSHLLWAIGLAMRRQDPQRSVRILSCHNLSENFSLPPNWQEGLQGTSLLILDDFHELSNHPIILQEIGMMVDWAINLGAQIVISGHRDRLEQMPNCKLTELISSGVSVHLEPPSVGSLILFLRSRSAGRKLLLSDAQLNAIILNSDETWRGTKSTFEQLALAIDAGDEVLDAADVHAVLEGRKLRATRGRLQQNEQFDLEELGAKIANDAMDYVLADPISPDVNIISELGTLREDDYEPPTDLIPEDSSEAAANMLDRLIGEELDRLRQPLGEPHAVDESEKHLLHVAPELSNEDKSRIDYAIADFNLRTEDLFANVGANIAQQHGLLLSLEEEMLEIAEAMKNTDSGNLSYLVERLKEIEEDLNQIDPDSIELPEWDKHTKRSRKKLKRKSSANPNIDEYTPTDWISDNSKVSVTDLFSLESGVSVMWPGPTKQILNAEENRVSVLWPGPTNNILIPKSE
ncbi:MAG: DnaA/Hda family protein [Candidatus Thermoplasmatota archaeon]|nr:DnaA/Hda family protein [Candidatus Thermoplasmatota archaeon]